MHTVRVTMNKPKWRVVGAFAFLAIIVTNVIRVFLLKLIQGHRLCELRAPECQRVLQSYTNTLEKETILETPSVFEMVCATQTEMQITHTRREVHFG